jgi:hypothetical protein
VVTFGVSTAVSFTAASVDFNGSVLVWFTWSWSNASWSFSLANFFVVHTLAEVALVFVFVPSTSLQNTVDVTTWWWSWSWSGSDWLAFVSWATVFNHTGDSQDWEFWIVASWSGWTLSGIALANFIPTAVAWSGFLTTVWSSVVLWAWSFAIVLWVERTVDFISASFFNAHSLWATSVVLDTGIDVAFFASSQQTFVTLTDNVFKRNTIGFTADETGTWEAGFWDTVPWSIFISGSVDVPSVSSWDFKTLFVDTFWWRWWGDVWNTSLFTAVVSTSDEFMSFVFKTLNDNAIVLITFFINTFLSATVIIRTDKSVSLVISTFDQSTSVSVTSAFQSLATAVFRSSFNVTFFEVFTTFWFWAGNFSAFFSDTNVFVTTIIDFVTDQVFVEFTFWNFWAVSIEALDVTSFATVTDSANITLIIPRFSEKSWTFVTINTSWWSWSNFWWWSSGDTFVGVAAWRWGDSLNVTVGTFNFIDVDIWAAFSVTNARVFWTVAFVLFSFDDEFRTESVGFFTHWWSITFWGGFTFTVDDVMATFIFISVTVDWDQVWSATVWIVGSTTFGFSDFDGFVFGAVVSFTFVGGFKNVTNIDFSTVNQHTEFAWTWSEWWGGVFFTIISVFAAVFEFSFQWFFTVFANFDKSQFLNMSQTFLFITFANFSGTTKIGWVSSKRFGLVSLASSGDITAVFWTTVGFRTFFDTTVTDAWHAFSFIFVPNVAGFHEVTLVVNAISATVVVFDALFDLASTTSFNVGGGVASWTRDFVQSWAITGASTVFDVSQTSKNFSSFFVSVFVLFLSGNNIGVLARANWIGNFNWFWTVWILNWFWRTFTVVTASVAFTVFSVQSREFWFISWARNWSWEAESEVGQNIWIASFWSFGNGVVGKTFVNGATISGVPDVVDFVGLTVVVTFFAFSGHATFTLNKDWGGSIFAEGIIEWVTKFWSTLAFVFVAAFVDRFRNWFVEDWTRWDFWSGAIFTINTDDFPELTTFRVSIGNDFMSFGIEVGWFWSTEFSFVVASSESGGGITTTVDTLVVTFPVITSFVAQSNGSVFVSTDVTWSANSFWTTGSLLFNWWASAFTWGDEINGWTKLSVTFTFVPLTKFVFSTSFKN